MSHLLCFGLGYSANRVAQTCIDEGWRVSGTTTRADKREALQRRGFTGLIFDGEHDTADTRAAIASATHVLLSIPPGDDGDPAFLTYATALRDSPALQWIGYYSTVGVYGDSGGDWVDEDTPAQPTSPRGKRRRTAELQWLDLGRDAGKTVTVLRLPGIYGPGRSAIEDMKAGTARRLIKPGQVFNRIHVDDIATATIAAMHRAAGQRLYNVTDDVPAPPQDVVAYAAKLLGLPVPPGIDFETADLSPMARSFYSESKRVSNARLKAELGVRLAYPSYREGLRAILSDRAAV